MDPHTAVTPAPAGFMRRFDGQLFPVGRDPGTPDPARRKLLIVLQHYDGDVARVNDLGLLIAELEKMLNEEADILIFSRYDTRIDFSPEVRAVLATRFRKILDLKNTRRASGYPYGPNEMWHELVNVMSTKIWRDEYYAFINLEPDCCPTGPDWIARLVKAWHRAAAEGKLVAGHYQASHPTPHFNGVAIYDTDMFSKVKGQALLGCDAEHAYDIAHAKDLTPANGQNIPEIFLDWKRQTITPQNLFAPRAGGVIPALYHGVQDDTAKAAVRARFVAQTAPAQTTATAVDARVYCYHDPLPGTDQGEIAEELNLWKRGWQACGWTPIVLTRKEASMHPRFNDYLAKVSSLPVATNPAFEVARWLRWLALDVVGGGLLTDLDVLPNALTPEKLERAPGFRDYQHDCPSVVLADGAGLAWWIAEVMAMKLLPTDQQDGRAHISDRNFLRRLVAEQTATLAAGMANPYPLLRCPRASLYDFGLTPQGIAVHFTARAVAHAAVGHHQGKPRSHFMRAFLKGEAWAV